MVTPVITAEKCCFPRSRFLRGLSRPFSVRVSSAALSPSISGRLVALRVRGQFPVGTKEALISWSKECDSDPARVVEILVAKEAVSSYMFRSCTYECLMFRPALQDQRYFYDIGVVCDTRFMLYSQWAVGIFSYQTDGNGEKEEVYPEALDTTKLGKHPRRDFAGSE